MRHLGRKWDHPVLAGRHVQPVDPAPIGRQHGLSIGCERIAGDQVAGEPRFLLVALDGQFQPALLATGQVADSQPGLIIDASTIDELGPVGREDRTEAAAEGLGDGVLVAGRPITTRDLGQRKIQVIIRIKHFLAFRVIEMLTILGGDGADGVYPLVGLGVRLRLALGDRNAGAAADVVHQKLEGPPGELWLARNEHIVALGRPRRRGEQALLVLGQWPRIRPVGIGDPQVLSAFPVAGERDQFAVGRVARLTVERQTRHDRLGLSSGDRDGVQVSQQFKEDCLAVRRDIERDPGSLFRRELDRSVRLERKALGLFLGLVLLLLGVRLLLAFRLVLSAQRGRRDQ